MKQALICGVSGQDGAYLAQLLLEKGYEVAGTSRDPRSATLANLERLGIADRVGMHAMVPTDLAGVRRVLSQVEPDEIYNLAGQSSVGLSFQHPVETFEGIALGTINLLQAVRDTGLPVRLFSAGSSECFGDTGGRPADETTALMPRSPYATAKAAAQWTVANYREAYGLFACTGILFNHESPLRPKRFVTSKIVRAACEIAAGGRDVLELGDMTIRRDWGWAPEYVDAMWRMLQHERPEDFVIATGQSHSLEAFCKEAFDAVGLDYREHARTNEAYFRPTDIPCVSGDPSKAERILGWRARTAMPDVARLMVEAERGADG